MAVAQKSRKRFAKNREYVRTQLASGREDYADILRELERMGNAPSRTSFYAWVRAETAEATADTSGPWLLAKDDTGRPDIVLATLGDLFEWSRYRRRSVTIAEARWIVRIVTAAPAVLRDPNMRGGVLFQMARGYLRAEAKGDVVELARLDLFLANVTRSAA